MILSKPESTLHLTTAAHHFIFAKLNSESKEKITVSLSMQDEI